MAKALTQTALRCLAPGVPDLYRGSEFWDLTLVDPDNRRPVDFDARERALAERSEDVASGAIKQALIARLLNLRREEPELFAFADYEPIAAGGDVCRRLRPPFRRQGDGGGCGAEPRRAAGGRRALDAEAGAGAMRGSPSTSQATIACAAAPRRRRQPRWRGVRRTARGRLDQAVSVSRRA